MQVQNKEVEEEKEREKERERERERERGREKGWREGEWKTKRCVGVRGRGREVEALKQQMGNKRG